MDKIIDIKKEKSIMTCTLKDGSKIPVNAITTETTWASGRKDCHIAIEDALNSTSKQPN